MKAFLIQDDYGIGHAVIIAESLEEAIKKLDCPRMPDCENYELEFEPTEEIKKRFRLDSSQTITLAEIEIF